MVKENTLLIATHNEAKLEQMQSLLANIDYKIISLADLGITYDVDETGTTLEENAILKAETYCKLSGLPTLADDSGLEVDALNGEPGIRTSRYAGNDATDRQKVAFLLEKMKDVPEGRRQAQFRCALAFAQPDKPTKVYEGECRGSITMELRGSLRTGFPYCLVFLIPETGKTLSELNDQGKIYQRHRIQALEKFKAEL